MDKVWSSSLFRKPLLLRLRLISCCSLVVVALGTLESHAQIVDGKRGWAGGDASMADAANSHWYYHWWHTKPAGADNANADWIPLVKYTNNLQNKLDIVTGYNDVDTILVLNEPERENQSDVTVAEAISIWPQFEATGLNLIAPAVSDNVAGRAWLDDFMAQANANNFRMDGVAFHWYGADNPNNPTAAANSFLNRVDYYWNTYNLPVWITEFAMHDWGGNYTDQQMLDANQQFLEVAIPGLETRSYVEAYSWYRGFSDSRVFEEQAGLLTPNGVGDAYIPSYGVGDTFNINGLSNAGNTIYLRGGQVTNTGAAIDNAAKNIYAIEGSSDLTGSADWGTGGSGWVEINAGATLQKVGSNTVRFNGSQINNQGSLRVLSGGLSLEGGAQTSGTGLFELHTGATLSMGKASDRAGVNFGQNLELHGGAVQTNTIADGTHTLSGLVTVHNTSTFSGNGLLIVNAPIAAPPGGGGGGVVKDGAGTLLLNNVNTYEGKTVIKDGTLRLGVAASITATPSIEVQPAGVLDVSGHAGGYALNGQTLTLQGQVTGSISAINGSHVAVISDSASIVGDLIISNSTVSVGGVGFNESPPTPPIVGTDLVLNFDAAVDTAGDATWTNAVNAANSLFFGATASPVVVSDSSVPGITAAYDASVTGAASGLNGFFEQQTPQLSRKDATFEVVFQVSDTSAGVDQVLFEVGAIRGVSFTLSNDQLAFNVDGDGAASALTTTLGAGWHHAVGVVDVVGLDDNLANDSLELFVNNMSIGVIENVLIDDWAGGNTTGIGGNSAGTAGTSSPIDFHGEIASARFYSDLLFTSAEVAQNFESLTGSGSGEATTMHIDGDYTQMANGTLAIDLLSPDRHDALNVSGTAALAGTLEIAEIPGFDPHFGDAFTILAAGGGLAGKFDTLFLPILDPSQVFVVRYDTNEMVLTVAGSEADFDFDGDVDNDDLAIWQIAYGVSSAGDANQDGITSGSDFLVWQRSFFGTGPIQSDLNAVPEPLGIQLLLALLITGLVFSSRDGNRQTT